MFNLTFKPIYYYNDIIFYNFMLQRLNMQEIFLSAPSMNNEIESLTGTPFQNTWVFANMKTH